jgi:N-acetylneuraminate synthase
MQIEGRKIGCGYAPYIIAEISANHNGHIEIAKQLISEAAHVGADAVKLQTYRPDTITLDMDTEDFKISEGLWAGRTLYELYQEAHMPWEWHAPLFEHARKQNITIFSSPFDFSAVDLLEDLNTPAYKIASFEAVDLALIQYAASTGKPLIISTGLANKEEIGEAIEAARAAGCKDLAVLHCVSGYPAPAEDYNLKTLRDIQRSFKLVTGLSDHTLDNNTAIASVALGAAIIEKHFTLDRTSGGPDDSFSLEPAELAALCKSSQIVWSALGQVEYGCKPSEKLNLKFRRSLYVTRELKPGDIISSEHVKSIRPGFGLAPKKYQNVIGSVATQHVKSGTALSESMFRYRQ